MSLAMTSENKPQRQIGVYSADSFLLEKVSSVANAFIKGKFRLRIVKKIRPDPVRYLE